MHTGENIERALGYVAKISDWGRDHIESRWINSLRDLLHFDLPLPRPMIDNQP
jgi:hypothetical protein